MVQLVAFYGVSCCCCVAVVAVSLSSSDYSLTVLTLLRPWLLLRHLHISPIAGIGGAAVGISSLRRSPPCIIIY